MAKRQIPNLTMEDARILFRNFSGNAGKFNAAGNRNFCLVLTPEVAEAMEKDGWNIKYLKPRDEDDEATPYIKVKVNLTGNRPANVVMITSKGRNKLSEELMPIVDWADIAFVDVIINPYVWEVDGETGVSAYLKSIYIHVIEDELELKYANVPDSGQNTLTMGQPQLQLTAGNDGEYVDFEER